MSANTGIEWTEATWNPIAGCTPVSPGCLNCYAAVMAHNRLAPVRQKYRGLTVLNNGRPVFNGTLSVDEDALVAPLKRKKPTMYFVNSMSDLFHESLPFSFVDKVFAVMALCPHHTFQVLTKRELMVEYLCRDRRWRDELQFALRDVPTNPGAFSELAWSHFTWPLPNVWLGVSVENQEWADKRIPLLLQAPAAVRFLSCEPLLGPIVLGDASGMGFPSYLDAEEPRLHWVIAGGESGGKARPCDQAWIASIVEQCKAANVPVFVKQLGAIPMLSDEAWRAMKPQPPLHAAKSAECPDGFCALSLVDPKGGTLEQWPAHLRVREMPRRREQRGEPVATTAAKSGFSFDNRRG